MKKIIFVLLFFIPNKDSFGQEAIQNPCDTADFYKILDAVLNRLRNWNDTSLHYLQAETSNQMGEERIDISNQKDGYVISCSIKSFEWEGNFINSKNVFPVNKSKINLRHYYVSLPFFKKKMTHCKVYVEILTGGFGSSGWKYYLKKRKGKWYVFDSFVWWTS